MSEYLTTDELADLLRIKKRKVYDLAASGQLPCSRAMGKLLFPTQAVREWIASNGTGIDSPAITARPNVILGSHDPLFDWAIRESRCGLATYFDGSLDGLLRYANREGVAAGLHLFDVPTGEWNVPAVEQRFGGEAVVLVEFCWRDRGLIIRPESREEIGGLGDLKGRRVVPRQPESGTQVLFEHLLKEERLTGGTDMTYLNPARNETDAALAVLEGKADAAFGLKALATQYRLAFVPAVKERFDLLVERRAWFEPPLQTLFAFCRSRSFVEKAAELDGYDASAFGHVHFNGP